jgi:hypothetical protein
MQECATSKAARYTWAAGQPRRLSPHGPSSNGRERVTSFCVLVSLPGSTTAGRIASLGGCYEGSLRNSATERDGNRARPEGNCRSQIRRSPAWRRWRDQAYERVSFVLAQRLLTEEWQKSLVKIWPGTPRAGAPPSGARKLLDPIFPTQVSFLLTNDFEPRNCQPAQSGLRRIARFRPAGIP